MMDGDFEIKLGAKIKNVRRSLKMTQQELASDKITRNMLSRIENGAASPSVGTLLHIADKLGVSAGYLLASEGDESEYITNMRVKQIRGALRSGDYLKCSEICASVTQSDTAEVSDDEIALAEAVSGFAIMLAHYNNGEFKSAYEESDAVAFKSGRSVYGEISDIGSYARLIGILSRYAVTAVPDADELPSNTPSSVYLFIKALHFIEESQYSDAGHVLELMPRENVYREVIADIILLAGSDRSRHTEAAASLEAQLAHGVTPFVAYRICGALEEYGKAENDYRLAYKYSTMRHNLFTNAMK